MIWIPIAIVVVILIVICASKNKTTVQVKPQPCISDEEFCCLLPDIPDDIALKVRDLLEDVSGWEREEIHPQTRLIEFELS